MSTRESPEFFEQLAHYLAKNGLKSTVQRDLIVNEFFRFQGHISAEELYTKLKKKHGSIGLATVYRTLKILTDAGLAEERRFNDGFTRYELSHGEAHHDHLVCTGCGKVEEFGNNEIEALQMKVARDHGFVIHDHKLELYGLCGACAAATTSVG
jgi:Fur family ferric uptake transcriptional regulator